MNLETGDPVVLQNAKGLEAFGLQVGDLGWVNSIAVVPGDKTYVFFMPKDDKKSYIIEASRVEVDEQAKAAGIKLDETTIHKGA